MDSRNTKCAGCQQHLEQRMGAPALAALTKGHIARPTTSECTERRRCGVSCHPAPVLLPSASAAADADDVGLLGALRDQMAV